MRWLISSVVVCAACGSADGGDGGEYALTATSDRFSTAKWAGLLGEHDLEGLGVEDFEVIDHGEVFRVPLHALLLLVRTSTHYRSVNQ